MSKEDTKTKINSGKGYLGRYRKWQGRLYPSSVLTRLGSCVATPINVPALAAPTERVGFFELQGSSKFLGNGECRFPENVTAQSRIISQPGLSFSFALSCLLCLVKAGIRIRGASHQKASARAILRESELD